MTRLRAKCRCGCKFEAFELPPDERDGKWIARTGSGFAAFLLADTAVFAAVAAAVGSVGTGAGAPDRALLARVVARTGDPAPDGQRYDTGLGQVCPRCGEAPVEGKVDKQMPEVVVGLPMVSHQGLAALAAQKQRAAILAALAAVSGDGRTGSADPAAPKALVVPAVHMAGG